MRMGSFLFPLPPFSLALLSIRLSPTSQRGLTEYYWVLDSSTRLVGCILVRGAAVLYWGA